MGEDRIGDVGDSTSEGQAADFTAGSLARKGAWGGTRGMGTRLVLTRSRLY
jgi:hypothetical protein